MARGRSKDKTLRLEKGAGDDRVFWEIKQSKATVTIRYGRHLGAGRTIKKAHASEAEAGRAYAEAIEEKRRAGYSEPVNRSAIGAESKKGVSARNPALEQIIEDNLDDPAGYLVYSDWLLEQGDPRAELITVQSKLARHPASIDLDRAESELLEKFEAELLGPLAKWSRIRLEKRHLRGLVWRYGFLRAARLRRMSPSDTLASMLQTLLEHPSARFLERLAIGRSSWGDNTRAAPALEVIARLAPRTLTWLLVGDGMSYETDMELDDLGPLWEAVAALRSLRTLIMGSTIVGPRAAPSSELTVESLVFRDVDPLALDSIFSVTGKWPRLTALHVTVRPYAGSLTTTRSRFGDLLSAAPHVKHLSVRQWVEGRPPPDLFARDVIEGAAAARVQRLDLEMPLSEAMARELCDREAPRRIPELSLAIEDLPGSIRARVRQALPRVEIRGRPEERDLADLDELIG